MPVAKPRKVYEADGRDRALLPVAWGLGVLLVNLFWSDGLPGLGITLLVAAWYGVLIWYKGRGELKNRGSRLLTGAIVLLTLTFSIYSNTWFRGWNLIALVVLGGVQLAQWTGMENWSDPSSVPKGLWLVGKGTFGYLPASLDTAKSLKGDRRVLTLLLGLLLTAPLLVLVVPLLLQADPYFALVAEEVADTISRLFGKTIIRVLLGFLTVPLLFGLFYSLRHLEQKECKVVSLPGVDPLLPSVILTVMDILYGFFIAVQSAALFGGPAYLERVSGLSYAEYARSGFFQLVFVAGLNLTLVLAAMQFGRKGEKGQGILKVLSTLLVLMSGVILISAAYRMTLYVSVYGLSFKRFLTYWGMIMLALLFAAAMGKVWKRDFSFFKFAFTIVVAGWLALNYCNVDRLVARYNVNAWQNGQSAVIDLAYLTHSLSYDALEVVAELPGEAQSKWGRLDVLLEGRRREAVQMASDWRTWSVSAWRAARG